MKKILVKIVREPALVTGVVTAALGLAVLFGIDITKEQVGGIVVFLGAVMALVRFLVTPAAEVAVQVKDGQAIAGAASTEPTGTPLTVLGADDPAVETSAYVPLKGSLLDDAA